MAQQQPDLAALQQPDLAALMRQGNAICCPRCRGWFPARTYDDLKLYWDHAWNEKP